MWYPFLRSTTELGHGCTECWRAEVRWTKMHSGSLTISPADMSHSNLLQMTSTSLPTYMLWNEKKCFPSYEMQATTNPLLNWTGSGGMLLETSCSARIEPATLTICAWWILQLALILHVQLMILGFPLDLNFIILKTPENTFAPTCSSQDLLRVNLATLSCGCYFQMEKSWNPNPNYWRLAQKKNDISKLYPTCLH